MNAAVALVTSLRSCPTWAALLCIAIAFAPGAKLHVHEIDQPSPPAGLLASLDDIDGEHSHVVGVHSAANATHHDHHDGTATDLDASPKVVLKKLLGALTFALFVFAALALFTPSGLPSFAARFLGARPPPERYHLVQPVRAPPAR